MDTEFMFVFVLLLIVVHYMLYVFNVSLVNVILSQ